MTWEFDRIDDYYRVCSARHASARRNSPRTQRKPPLRRRTHLHSQRYNDKTIRFPDSTHRVHSSGDPDRPGNEVLNLDVAGAVPTQAGAIADRLLARLRASTPYADGTFGLVRSTIVYVRRPGVWKVVTQGGAPAPAPTGHP